MLFTSCGVSSRVSYRNTDTGHAVETGMASWYGPNFHGNLTANGEVYDMYGLTAAHRTLPFNTLVRVQNLDNGEEVIVRINDRGPFAKNRIIDLSKKAAGEINMIGPGTARVRLYIVSGGLKNPANLKVATYTVQLGSFRNEKRALKKSGEISGSRVEKVYLEDGTAVYRIYYGNYADKGIAEKNLRKLKRQGHDGYVKQLEN